MPVVETLSGRKWQVTQEGQGEPLVFIHGWSVDSRIWAAQRQFFAEKFQVWTIDLPGHGQTPWQDLTLQDIAQDFAEILFTKEGKKNHVVGSSFGGLVAFQLYDLFPDKIRSLILAGSQPKFTQSADYPWGLSVERLEKLRGQLVNDYPTIVPIFFRSLFTAEERASERFKWLQGFRKSDAVPDRDALLRLLEVLCQIDLREVLRRVNVPMLFVNGTDDPICPKEFYMQLQKQLPQAQFEWFKGCGHFPFVSRPQEFNQIVDDFLKQVKE